jgi:hypothetical protein
MNGAFMLSLQVATWAGKFISLEISAAYFRRTKV